MIEKTEFTAWAQAFLAVLFFMAISNVVIRYAMIQLDVHPIIFSCAAFASSALILLLYSGPGILAKETIRSFDTWIYGIVLMLSYIVGLVLFGYVTSTEGTMLQKTSVIISLIASWFFLQREPNVFQWLGLGLVLVGIGLVMYDLSPLIRQPAITLAVIFGAIQAARMFTAELHRPHELAATQKKDGKAKVRVIGFVMFVMSIIFITTTFLLSLSQHGLAQPIIGGIPKLSAFIHAPSIYSGMIMGVLIVAPLRLLEFSSTRVIKAENYAAIAALTFFSTLFWEWITQPITGLSLASINKIDIVAGTLISLGGLVIALSNMRSHRQKDVAWKKYVGYQAQNPRRVQDARDIVLDTLAHFRGDHQQAAIALDVPTGALQAIRADRQHVLGFSPELLARVARNYRHKVANRDPLSGLLNRSAFISAIQEAIDTHTSFHLLFIDLNKFKPVNDTYGHEAGDYVLAQIAQRLQGFLPTDSAISRLGGDEFCALWFGADEQVSTLQNVIKDHISQPMDLPNIIEPIEVGASIGIAIYPTDGQEPETLLSAADRAMYGMKRQR